MKMNNKQQDGFSSVEAILILVIVVIIGFVGWFVYNSNKKANSTIDTANQSNNSAQAVNLTSSKTAQAAGTKSKSVAIEMLSYNRTNPTDQLSKYVDKHINDGQFTAAFKTSVDSGSALAIGGSVNPITCQSGSSVTSFKLATSSLSGNSATVVLTPVIATSPKLTSVPQLTLNYVNSIWSIDSYQCIASPS